ncbi:hypothetical protein [Ideonella sp.]|uniref:hypothetical protein n=1 Tax=Ideonella sp. TaxID=1929293 RepID=UPI003BB7933E
MSAVRPSLFWLPYTVLAGRRWLLGAWFIQLAALAAVLIWVDERWPAIALAGAISAVAGTVLWVQPAGSLLVNWRTARELRLPRESAGVPSRMALLLVVNLLPAALLMGLRSESHLYAVYAALFTLCLLMGMLVFVLLPTGVLVFIGVVPLSASLLPGVPADLIWTDGLRIAVALGVLSAELLLVAALVRRHLGGDTPVQGFGANLLSIWAAQRSGTGGGASTYEQPARALRATPTFLLPRLHLKPGMSVNARVAHLLGQPYAPGFTRRFMLVAGAIMALVLLLLGAARLPTPGLVLMGFVFSVPMTVSTRLGQLFRRDAPELSEWQLLPGQGDAAARRQRALHLMFWRPVQAQVVLTLGCLLGLAGLDQWAQAPALLALSTTLVAVMTLESARYLARGVGWFGKPWTGALVQCAVAIPGFVILSAVGWAPALADGLFHGWLQATLAITVALAVYSLWVARRSIGATGLARAVWMGAADRALNPARPA